MKHKIIKRKPLAAACLTGVVSTSALAFEPQDYGTSTLIGYADFNVHSLLHYNNVICGPLCVQFSSESGHNFTHFRVPDSVPGASETLTCDMTDASGNILSGTEGNTPEVILSYSYNDDFGGIPGNDVTSDQVNGPAFPAFGNTLVMWDCELETDGLGKISGGWAMNFAELVPVIPPPRLYTVYDFDNRKFIVLQCVAVPGFTLTITEVRAIDGVAIQGGDLLTVPSGCTSVESVFDMNYHTCDTRQPCGSGSKAVPVPAFAAAMLGLGIIGVVYQTASRRRGEA